MGSLEQGRDTFNGWDIQVIIPEERSNIIIGEVYKKNIGNKTFAVSISRVVDKSYKTLGWAVDSIFKKGDIPAKGNRYFASGKNQYTKAYDNLVKRIQKINLEGIK